MQNLMERWVLIPLCHDPEKLVVDLIGRKKVMRQQEEP
jgi:hypothetical protein